MVTFPPRVDPGTEGATDARVSTADALVSAVWVGISAIDVRGRRPSNRAVRAEHTSRDTLIAISTAVNDLVERLAARCGAALGG